MHNLKFFSRIILHVWFLSYRAIIFNDIIVSTKKQTIPLSMSNNYFGNQVADVWRVLRFNSKILCPRLRPTLPFSSTKHCSSEVHASSHILFLVTFFSLRKNLWSDHHLARPFCSKLSVNQITTADLTLFSVRTMLNAHYEVLAWSLFLPA